MRVPLGKWRPDAIPYEMNPGEILVADNVLPYIGGKYMPARDKVMYSTTALSEAALTAKMFKDSTGSYYGFIGTATKLYRMNPDKTLTDVTRLAGAYSASWGWCFVQYGDWVVATNGSDVPQVIKGMGSVANFVNLGGSPPVAKYCLLYSNRLILANLTVGGINYPKDVQWSAPENIELWPTGAAGLVYGSDRQSLADADGDITGINLLSGMFVVLHERSITPAWDDVQYTFRFQMNRIRNIGCIGQGAIISYNNYLYFWGRDNIYVFDGNTATPVGNDLKNTIFNNLHTAYYDRVTHTVDMRNNLIYWAYATTASLAGEQDRILVYNTTEDRFALLKVTVSCMIALQTGGITIADLETLYGTVDNMPYPWDSAYFQASASKVGCLDNTTKKVALLDGAVLTGTIETGEITSEDLSVANHKLSDGDIITIDNVRPSVSKAVGAVSVSIGKRMSEDDEPIYTSVANVGSTRTAYVIGTGRFLRARLTLGDHSGVASIEADVRVTGSW